MWLGVHHGTSERRGERRRREQSGPPAHAAVHYEPTVTSAAAPRATRYVVALLAAIWIVAATTGMRRGELLGLRWGDLELDAEQPTLRIRGAYVQYGAPRVEKEPKTPRSRRTIALDTSAVAALRRHSAAQAKERLAAGATYEPGDRVFADEIGEGPHAVALHPVATSLKGEQSDPEADDSSQDSPEDTGQQRHHRRLPSLHRRGQHDTG